MKRLIVGLAALSATLSGCVSPLVMPNPPAWQAKATNAVNWKHFAEWTVAAMPKSSPESQSVYVMPSPYGTPFADIYTHYLEEQLFAAGYPVVKSPESASIIMGVKANWVVYPEPLASKRLAQYFTLDSGLLGIVAATRHISRFDTALGAAAAAGPVFDLLAALNGATDAEVVVTSEITTKGDDHIHFIRTETFYVRPSDVHLYRDSTDQPPMSGPPSVFSLPVSGQ